MSKTDDHLRSDISANESLSEWGGWAVFAGLILEVFLAVSKSIGYELKPIWENWSVVVADCLIAGGVYLEIHFGWRARIDSDELTRRSEERLGDAIAHAAKANERSAQLEKEAADARERVADIERLTSWRRLSIEQVSILAKLLSESPKYSLQMYHVTSDPETTTYAYEIGGMFKEAGWPVVYISASFHGKLPVGVNIPLWPQPNAAACALVMQTLMNAGIELFSGAPPPIMMISSSGDNITEPFAEVFVGIKPSAAAPGPDNIQKQMAAARE